VSPELLQAAISDSCGDYHDHSVQQEKSDAHAEKFHQVIFSRLDVVSAFHDKGEKSAWQT
jgi:hypothetical protein